MPEYLSVRRIEGNDVVAVVREEQPPGGREHVRHTATTRPVVTPRNLAGLVVDRQQRAADVADFLIHTAPALRSRIDVRQVIHAVRAAAADIKQSSVGTEARRLPVGRAT